MIDNSNLSAYLTAARKRLGGDKWINEADKTTIGAENLGGIARRYTIHCFMTDIPVDTCVRTIKAKFPEKE